MTFVSGARNYMEQTDIHDILLNYWGYGAFRPMQQEIVQDAMDGRDVLALLPTGGGKSLCFQVPAMAKPGICLVVSPLIALMQDQVSGLRERGIKAETLVSGTRHRDIDRILDNCIYGQIKFLYLSPERLRSDLVRTRIAKMNVNLLAVDEAHCISQWGYDFRPSYLQIAEVRDLVKAPVMALTATATPKVVLDIQEKLHFPKHNVRQRSFHRPELSYNVVKTEDKLNKCFEVLKAIPGSGIIYVRNRRRTKHVADLLNKQHISAAHYHAGLDRKLRNKVQADWIDGKTRIMVATNAFGMGIDKPDVRSVVHLDLPDSPEAYFQEAGRGGRDGKRSFAVLIFHEGDALDLSTRVAQQFPTQEEIKKVYVAVCDQLQLAEGSGKEETFELDLGALYGSKKFDHGVVNASLKVLALNGYFELNDRPQMHSSIKFTATKEQIYDLVHKGNEEGRLVDLLIRSHGRLFEERVAIDEAVLTGRANISEANVSNILQKLEARQMLEYRERTGKPQITFLYERIPIRDLSISNESYGERRIRAEERKDAMLEFVTQHTECRSAHLLRFFGEKDPHNCGSCDVCRGRHSEDSEAIDQAASQMEKAEYAKHNDERKPLTAEESKAARYILDRNKKVEPNGAD